MLNPSRIKEELTEYKDEILQIIDGMNSLNLLRDSLKKDFDLPGLKERLQSLPEKIKDSQVAAETTKAGLEICINKLKVYEAEFSFVINKEKDNNGRLKFSNDPQRKAESILRLSKDELYGKLKTECSANQMDLAMAEAETDKLRRDFQGMIAVKDLIVAEINLYSK